MKVELVSRPRSIETRDLIEKETHGENLHREATLKSPGIIDEESPFSKLITDY